MDESEIRNGRTIGSVKAAISLYGGGKINKVSTTTMKKSQNDASNPEKSTSSKAQELHLAKNRINQINENTRIAVSERSQIEFELLKAKKLVRKLTSQIEESKSNAKEFNKGRTADVQPALEENDQYNEVAREVEVVKREFSKLKLDIQHTLEEKFRAEKQAHDACLRLESYTCTAENLSREIKEANEEEVLVELAKIQAQKEIAEIEARRKEEKDKYSLVIRRCQKKMKNLKDEIEKMKGLEDTLDVNNSDAAMLQSELNSIKEMDGKFQENERLKNSALESAANELEAAKKGLEVVKRKGFYIMRSMDVIRDKLIKILSEKGEIRKREEITEKGIEKLNLELLKAKDKLDFSRKSEEKTKTMFALMNLVKEKEAGMKEEKLKAETENIKAETQKIETDTKTNEERLQTLLEELEVAKTVEDNALGKLKALAISVAKARASTTKSTITISKFEYDYLTGCAAGARELADKKVAAARAWAEAFMAEERETMIKLAITEKKITELTLKEEREVQRTEESEKATVLTKEALQKRTQQGKLNLQERRSTREHDYSSTPGRKTRFRRLIGPPATRPLGVSTSFTMKRRRKVMLKIAKYFANELIENEESAYSKGAEN